MQLQGPRNHFLARPFWRDYVLAYVLIGLGFMLSSPNAAVHQGVGIAILACGALIFLCAVGWSLYATCTGRRSRELCGLPVEPKRPDDEA